MWRSLAVSTLLVFGTTGSASATEQPPAHEQRGQPVSIEDLEILDRTDQLLVDEAHWNRNDNRECPPAATTISLYCALHTACTEVLGRYDHRRVALQEVRFAVERVSDGREFEHRLMGFNNLPETSFSDVKKVLASARAEVAARLARASE